MKNTLHPVWDLKSQYAEYEGKSVFDCLLAEYVLSGGEGGLKKEITLEKYSVAALEELAEIQRKKLSENPELKSLYEEVELPLVGILHKMEHHGIAVNKKRLEEIGTILEKGIAEASEHVLKEAGTAINLSSPAQVGAMLVAKFSVPLKKTATGQFATGERELSKLAPMYPVIPHILRYRTLSKLKTTYIDALLPKIAEDGRIHTTYNQMGAISGRLSSSNPNMQNIPSSDDVTIDIKSAFVASPGYVLVAYDYSQQELRILAHLADEEKLKDAFSLKKDIHTVSASTIFTVPYDKVTRQQRMIAKTINFGVIYGMGSFGLAQTLDIPVPEAEMFIDQFYALFPKIRSYYDHVITTAAMKGYAETIMGRRRFVPHHGKVRVPIANATRRELINFPIQGSAADLMKKAMVHIDEEILQKHTDTRLLLQIHDELLFEIPEQDMKERVQEIQKIMNTAYPLSVPMEVGIRSGTSWGKMT